MGHQPTQANTGGRRGSSAKPPGPDDEVTAIIYGGEAARPTAVVFRGGDWQTGQKVGISVGASLAVLERVVECGENLEPPLDSRSEVSHFADACQRLVIRRYAKFRAPEVAEAFNGPDNAASFQVERSPVSLGIEGSAADVSDGPH